MAIKFRTIGQIEHGEYPFKDAITSVDTYNGAFGTVTDSAFAVAKNASKAIMQIEVGDDASMPKYAISKNAHVRVVDFSKLDGKEMEIYDYPLPDGVKVGDKLVSQADGSLKADTSVASTAFYLEVTDIIGNNDGVVVLVHGATA